MEALRQGKQSRGLRSTTLAKGQTIPEAMRIVHRPEHIEQRLLPGHWEGESKNASVVRKHLGYSHIPQRFAAAVNRFTCDVLTPYINFHRPCFFPHVILDDKGRQRRR